MPANTLVYRSRPEGYWCQHQWQVTNGVPALTVAQLGQHLSGPRYQVRPGERGTITNLFAMTRVWSRRVGEVAEEWLVIRQEGPKRTYAWSQGADGCPSRTAGVAQRRALRD
jgi:hypothetical protein